MTRLELAILKWAPIRIVTDAMKRVVLPGFEGLSLYEVGKFFYLEMRNVNLNERCAAVTYNFVMAIPPSMLFLFALVPYLPLKDAEHTILAMVRLISPTQGLYKSISSVIVDFMHTEQRKVLSFGILLTLYFSSNGIMGLMRSFDNSEHVYVQRSDLKRRWVAIKLTFLLYCVIILAMVAFIIQTEWVNTFIQKIFVSVFLGKLLTVLLVIFIVLCAISVIYSYGPSISHKFRFISPGSVFATILLVLATIGFYYMANNFLNYNKVYGSIGTLIAFMVWIWLNTMVILIGFELNVSIVLGKISRAKNAAKNKVL